MKALVVCKHPEYSHIQKIIKETGFKAVYIWKNKIKKDDLRNIDIVISIGGDGTVLSASHYLSDKPLLAVNHTPKTSEGVLTTHDISELKNKLKKIHKGFKTEKLERIQVSVNGKILPLLALNEVFIANSKAYFMSKYKIRFRNREEIQRSSGVIFSTGTGSTAWFKSSGGIPFSPQSRFIKMITREPYIRRLLKFSMKKLKIKEKEHIEIIPLTLSVLAIDSIREIKLNKKDRIRIEISKHPLLRIK